MVQIDYSKYELADLAADEYFVTWVIHPDEKSDLFWNAWQIENPGRAKVIHEARLLVLLMQSRKLRMNENQKESLWNRIHNETLAVDDSKVTPIAKPAQRYSLVYKIAASVAFLVAASAILYFTNTDLVSDNVTAQNPKGKKSVIYLEDGTKVWLNADSKLSYSKSFEGKNQRVVELEGEAFFDVAEDKNKPFIVKTSDVQVRVLGTAFNVKSYRGDQQIETTLLRGRVEMNMADGKVATTPVVLNENQQAVFVKDSEKISVANVLPQEIGSWKDGLMVFDNTPFSEIKTSLERWYGVEIILTEESSKTCRFSTTFENEPITKVLELLKSSSGITYEIKGSIVTINGSLCQNSQSDIK